MTAQQLASFRDFVRAYRAMRQADKDHVVGTSLEPVFAAQDAWHESFRLALAAFGCEAQTYAMDRASITLRKRFLGAMRRLVK